MTSSLPTTGTYTYICLINIGIHIQLWFDVIFVRTRYTYAELTRKPLPEGVDPGKLEMYLSEQAFEVTNLQSVYYPYFHRSLIRVYSIWRNLSSGRCLLGNRDCWEWNTTFIELIVIRWFFCSGKCNSTFNTFTITAYFLLNVDL